MAVSVARALVTAQLQSAWNRLRHESGLAGTAGTVVVLVLVVVPALLLPSLLMLRIGAALGEGLARGGSDELLFWNGVQGVFTLLFALLGSFRFRPALSVTDFRRYPLTRGDLALAELPAAVFEVFPLLGVAGIVASNAGLVSRMPAMTPLIVLLTFVNVAGMLALMVLAASVWRLVIQRRLTAIAACVCFITALSGVVSKGLMESLRAAIPTIAVIVQKMPGAFGSQGLSAWRQGHLEKGASGLLTAAVATAGLVCLAALAHHRALLGGAWVSGKVRRERPPARDRGPAVEVGRLFFKQLSSSRSVWVPLLTPLLMTGIGAFLAREIGRAMATDKVLPEGLISVHQRLQGIPFLAVTLFLTVAMNSQVWMNQFGYDRSAIHALLHLPIAPRDILVGKVLGLLELTALGWVICGAGVLTVYRPSAREVIGGVGAASLLFIVTSGAGQFVSLLAPRAVPKGGMAPAPPLYLSWIPAALLLSVPPFIAGIWTLGAAAGYWFAPLFLWAAVCGALLAWRSVLPQTERLFLASREKLLSM